MTNKFNYLVHELIHVTSTLSKQERATAKSVYAYLKHKHNAYCKSVLSRTTNNDMRTCSMLLIPSDLCSKFKCPSSFKIYTTDSFATNNLVISAIEKALDFTNAQVDWFSSFSCGKVALWEEFNKLSELISGNHSVDKPNYDNLIHIDDMILIGDTFNPSSLSAKAERLTGPIIPISVDISKITQYLILRSIIESYDRAIRITILNDSWYSSMLYIPDSDSVYHYLMEVCNNEQLLRKLVILNRKNSIEYDTNHSLCGDGFSHSSDCNAIGAYYLLLSEQEKQIVKAIY